MPTIEGIMLADVNNQNELDEVDTSKGATFAKVTAEFGTWKLNDLLLYTVNTWQLFIRQGTND